MADPLTCGHRTETRDGRSRCMAHGGTYVDCAEPKYGEPPMCCYEPPDNSPEAMARRAAWIGENG